MAAVIDRLQLPAEHVWLTDDDAALYTGFSTGHFQQRIICLPGFPKPSNLHGRRRWNCASLSRWLSIHAESSAQFQRRRPPGK